MGEHREMSSFSGSGPICAKCWMAWPCRTSLATEVERLKGENERLRSALLEIAGQGCMDPDFCGHDSVECDPCFARAALSPSTDDQTGVDEP